MALLDYMFPMSQAPESLMGLLGEDEAKKARQQAQISGLLNFGAALLANSGETQQPMNFGQRLAPALLGGYQAAQGSFDSQLKDRMYAQKIAKENAFNKAIQGAFESKPTGTGLTQTGVGSQAEMLSRPEFGGKMAADSTVGALMSNPNVPMQKSLNQNKFMAALAEYNPLEFAKMQATVQKDTSPAKIKEFQAFQEMDEGQRQAYIQMQRIMNPPSQTTFIDKGNDELAKLDAKAIGVFSDAATSANQFANVSESINTLLKGKGGGDVVKVGATVAKSLGLDNSTVTANDLANALQVKAATQVRATGSGSTSDLEFGAFMSALPSLANSEQGRQFMADGYRAFAKRNALLERKARELFDKKQYSAAAIAEYDQSLGAVLDPAKFNFSNTAPANTAPKRRNY